MKKYNLPFEENRPRVSRAFIENVLNQREILRSFGVSTRDIAEVYGVEPQRITAIENQMKYKVDNDKWGVNGLRPTWKCSITRARLRYLIALAALMAEVLPLHYSDYES